MSIVLKFGGSILDNAEDFVRICELVKGRKDEEPVVVLSAVKGVTDSLIGAIGIALKGEREISGFIDSTRERHLELLKGIKNPEIGKVSVEKLVKKLGVLESALLEVNKAGECSPRLMDIVQTMGERLSAIVLEGFLLDTGVAAECFGADEIGIITDSDFGKATPIMDETEKNLQKNLAPVLKEKIAIVTGFFGIDGDGNIACFGRGGTDFSAAIIASALDAGALELWKDVDGFMSADPKIVENAKLISKLSYDEAEELGYFGAKIFYPRTATPLRKKGIKILIKNISRQREAGTTIGGKGEMGEHIVKSVATKREIAIITIKSPEIVGVPGMLTMIFSALSEKGINVDVVSTSETAVSLTIDEKDLGEAKRAVGALEMEIEKLTFNAEVGLIGLIGEGMKNTLGIAGKLFGCIGDEGINVEMISQGASEINITFIVSEKDLERAVKTIHREFIG